MCSQAIDQKIVPSVLGTAQVFPVTWEKYSDLLPGYTLNNCIIYLVVCHFSSIKTYWGKNYV
jgi:hypothetical protein